MKPHPRILYGMCVLFVALLAPCTAMAEDLTAFTSRCESDLVIPQNSITGFDCRNGIELPTQQFGKPCDSHALLRDVEDRAPSGTCTSFSRLGVKTFSNPDVVAVWVCRKYAGIDNVTDMNNVTFDKYHDIAMIVHNRKNGKTCFFQNNLDSTPFRVTPVIQGDGPIIPGPKDSDARTVWDTPAGAADGGCTNCHKNDAFIVTPHVAEALNFHGMIRFSPKGGFYSVVGSESGLDFDGFNEKIVRKEGGCGGLCHYDPGVATGDALARNWMPPGNANAPHWKTLATRTTPEMDTPKGFSPYNFNPHYGQFYTLRANGEIRGFNGSGFNGTEGGSCTTKDCPHWTLLGSRTDTAEIAASDTKLYSRETTGFIREFTGVQCDQINSCPGWLLLDNNPNTTQIGSGAGVLYQMRHDHSIWRYIGTHTQCNEANCPGWEKLDNNSATVEFVASGSSLYKRHTGGAVFQFTGTPCSGNSCPGWQMIANDPRTIQLVIGNRSSLYMFQQLGAIWKYTGTPCNSTGCPGWRLVDFDNPNTKQVVAGSDNLYRLHKNGEVWHYLGTGQSWEQLDNHLFTDEISASVNGLMQRHAPRGDVYRYIGPACSNGSCPGWTRVQDNPNTIDIVSARQ